MSRNLGTVYYHQWIEFFDANGKGLCEPEAFIIYPTRIVLFEMKLTGGIVGKLQMEGLYAPLLEMIHGKPVHCLQICKWTTRETPGPHFASPEDFIRSQAKSGTWHWIGDA